MFPSLRRVSASDRNVCFDSENNTSSVAIRLERKEDTFLVLLTKPAGLEQWDSRTAVLASHSACPKIGYCGLCSPARVSFLSKVFVGEILVQSIDVGRAVFLYPHQL